MDGILSFSLGRINATVRIDTIVSGMDEAMSAISRLSPNRSQLKNLKADFLKHIDESKPEFDGKKAFGILLTFVEKITQEAPKAAEKMHLKITPIFRLEASNLSKMGTRSKTTSLNNFFKNTEGNPSHTKTQYTENPMRTQNLVKEDVKPVLFENQAISELFKKQSRPLQFKALCFVDLSKISNPKDKEFLAELPNQLGTMTDVLQLCDWFKKLSENQQNVSLEPIISQLTEKHTLLYLNANDLWVFCMNLKPTLQEKAINLWLAYHDVKTEIKTILDLRDIMVFAPESTRTTILEKVEIEKLDIIDNKFIDHVLEIFSKEMLTTEPGVRLLEHIKPFSTDNTEEALSKQKL